MGETKEELDQLEIDWIAKCDAVNSDEYYNIAYGGWGTGSGNLSIHYGKHLSEEHRKKISEANSGENNYFYGKNHSEETKRKISEFAKNMSEEHRKKISEFAKTRTGKLNPMYGVHRFGELNPNYGTINWLGRATQDSGQ